MSAIRAIMKLVATEKVRREIENGLRLQLEVSLLELLELDRTSIQRKHLRNETTKFLTKMKNIYEQIYLRELEEMYDTSEHSLVSSKINIPNNLNIIYSEGIPYQYILVWYGGNTISKSIEFRGLDTYKKAVEVLYYVIVELDVSIEDIFFIEDVETILDVDSIINNYLQ